MKQRILLLLCLIFHSVLLYSQQEDEIVIVYRVSDKVGNDIQNVNLSVVQGDSVFEIFTDVRGLAICRVKKYGELESTFRHVNYSKLTTIEEIYENTRLDTLRFNVILNSMKSLDLAEVKVSAPGVPEIVFSSKRLSVQDFELVDSDNIILLAYPKQLKKGSELLLYDGIGEVKHSIQIKGATIELTRDYEGHIYLIQPNGCKRIIVNNNSLELIDLSLFYYRRFIEPIIATSNNKMFFTTYDALYPEFDYYFFDVIDSSYQKFASVSDTDMLEMYRAEYRFANMYDPIEIRQKLNAKQFELDTGIDAEQYYGRMHFTRTQYYKAPFGPMYQVGDSLFLFDYHSDTMKVFNSNGRLKRKHLITHDYNERRSGWQKALIQDRVTDEVYALFEKEGFQLLRKINLKDGSLSESIKLNHRFTESIQVFNGFIYYVYRPFESYQKKYFWREKMPMKNLK
ncbi:MAG: hypothetical protein ACPGVI_02625 [Crocinitomicaceae bacterium]